MYCKFLSLILLSATVFLSSNFARAVAVTDQGYTMLVTADNDGNYSGTLLEKPDVFALELKEGQYRLQVLDAQGNTAFQLNAEAPAGENRLAVQFERILEPAQGRDGFRGLLFINGKRAVEQAKTPLKLSAEDHAVLVRPEFSRIRETISEYPRQLPYGELRKIQGIQHQVQWNPDRKDTAYLHAESMVAAWHKGAGAGNPFKGIFNKASETLLIPESGLSWEIQYREPSGAIRYADPADFQYSPGLLQMTEPLSVTALYLSAIIPNNLRSSWQLINQEFGCNSSTLHIIARKLCWGKFTLNQVNGLNSSSTRECGTRRFLPIPAHGSSLR